MHRITFFLALCLLFLSKSASAQELKEFYQGRGGDYLSCLPGCGKAEDITGIRKLFAPRLSVLAKQRLQFLLADTEWRTAADDKRAASGAEKLIELTQINGIVGAMANLSLGDYFWLRSKASASFPRAKIYYGSALTKISSSPAHADRITRMVLDHVIRPVWLKDKPTYGSFGNYLSSDALENVLSIVTEKSLKAEIKFLLAKSLAQEAKPEEEVCAAFQEAVREKSEFRDQALFDFAQFVSGGDRCSTSSDALLKQVVAEGKNPAIVAKAKQLLGFTKEGAWSLTLQNKRAGEVGTISIRGPSGKSTRLILAELGLRTDAELEARKAAQLSWTKSTDQLFNIFTAPVKSIIDRNVSAGVLDESRILAAGPYKADLVGKNDKGYLLISDLLLLVHPEGDQIKLMSVSLKSGTPLSDVELELHRRTPAGLRSKQKVFKFKTDSTGLASFKKAQRMCAKNEECESEELVLIGRKFRHTAFMSFTENGVIWPFEGDPSFWIVLSSQTPRPGEILSWNLFIRPDMLRKFSSAQVQVKIRHPNGPVFNSKGGPVDQFGRIGGVIKLPKNWSAGKYKLDYTVQSKITGEILEDSVSFDLTTPNPIIPPQQFLE